MKSSRSRNCPEFAQEKRSLTQPPFGPSVSGDTKRGSHYPITSMLSNMMSGKLAPLKPKAFSDDSYDSSSSFEEKSGPHKLTQIPVEAPQSRKVETKVHHVTSLKEPSGWERTRKVNTDEIAASKSGKKSKRHSSLDAKTARFYAKRQQTGWTESRQLGASSSDDEGGLRSLKREASPRRKRGSKETSSVSSKTPSRDPSVAPSPRLPRSTRPDLPPSSNGVAKAFTRTADPVVPVIRVSTDDALKSTAAYYSPPFGSLTKAPSIEDWINARSLSSHDRSKGFSSSNLSSTQLSARERLFPVNFPTESSASNLPWNHSKSRRSLPVGVDERILNEPHIVSRDVKNKRQLFETVAEISDTKPNRYFSANNIYQKPAASDNPYSARKRLLVVPEHGKIGVAVNSVLTEKFHSDNHTIFSRTPSVSQNITQTRQNKQENIYDQLLPSQLAPRPAKNEPVQKWNSDWQLHQSSSGVSSPYRPSSISAFDSNRLRVPGTRLAPLKEVNHLELERALEELDEFYESLSAKSDEVILKSSQSNLRSDSGLSSNIGHKEEHIYAEPTPPANNPARLDYTRDWVQYDGSNQLQNGRKTTSLMALNQHASPYRRAEQASPKNSIQSWTSNVDVRNDNFPNFKQHGESSRKPNVLPSPSYLLMNVVHTPTVFTGNSLEFQRYPGTNRPQPHQEWDDLSARKIIHAQNMPAYKVTADLSKQLPSARNDYAYATPDTTENFALASKGSKRPKEPDTVRDDVAFRQLRNDKKVVGKLPTSPVKEDKNGPKLKWISSSIRNLAKQFESHPKAEQKAPIVRRTSNAEIMATMQVNGKKFSLSRPTVVSNNRKDIPPKILPMNDQQMDDLLHGLNAVSSLDKKLNVRNPAGISGKAGGRHFDQMTRFAVIV